MITILTPTYNRKHLLSKAYESLIRQTDKNFEWIIVDDGSSDNTEELIKQYIKENKIDIKYYYKENGGKHTAINLGTKKANGELIIMLDSDDYLSDDAVELVYQSWGKYKNDPTICGVCFLKDLSNPFREMKPFNECVSNVIEFQYNKDNRVDMCEIIRKDILEQYQFPIFKNERFLSEIIVFGEISKKYNMAYIPKTIYFAEYLDDGLSKNWFKLVVNNPLGARANALLFMSKEFRFGIRLKNSITFNVFSIIAKEKVMKETKMKFCAVLFYIPSYVIAKLLSKKYKEE